MIVLALFIMVAIKTLGPTKSAFLYFYWAISSSYPPAPFFITNQPAYPKLIFSNDPLSFYISLYLKPPTYPTSPHQLTIKLLLTRHSSLLFSPEFFTFLKTSQHFTPIQPQSALVFPLPYTSYRYCTISKFNYNLNWK